jgi:hypothetical protein
MQIDLLSKVLYWALHYLRIYLKALFNLGKWGLVLICMRSQ